MKLVKKASKVFLKILKSLSRQNPWGIHTYEGDHSINTLSQMLLMGFAKMASYISLCF